MATQKRRVSQLVKLLISLSLGIAIVALIYASLSPSDIAAIQTHIFLADYRWIGLSVVLHLMSHISRAWRWKYTLAPIEVSPKYFNSFFSVMVGYLVNLAVPRLGEASRCATLARFERAPFDKLLGTVIAERVADLVMLLGIVCLVFIFQYDTLYALFTTDLESGIGVPSGDVQVKGTLLESFQAKLPPLQSVLITMAIMGLLLVLAILVLRRISHPIAGKIRGLIKGFMEGLKSIYTMPNKGYFLMHTCIIWALYILMFWVAMFSLEGTAHVPFVGVMAAFVMGSIGIVLVQGGLGAYPLLVTLALSVYGVDENMGMAFGWINWTAQTLMIILVGVLAFILLPQLNKQG